MSTEKPSRIEDKEEAEELAYGVKALAGKKLEEVSEDIIAMRQIPGLEEQVKEAQGKLEKLFESTEENLEGKKWAPIMAAAFKELGRGYTDFLFHEYLSKTQELDKFPDFVKFLVHKFGPKLRYFEPPTMQTKYYFLRIPGTNYIFQLEGDEGHPSQLRLKRAEPDFLKQLREPPQK